METGFQVLNFRGTCLLLANHHCDPLQWCMLQAKEQTNNIKSGFLSGSLPWLCPVIIYHDLPNEHSDFLYVAMFYSLLEGYPS